VLVVVALPGRSRADVTEQAQAAGEPQSTDTAP
jgi:hypothetical protein